MSFYTLSHSPIIGFTSTSGFQMGLSELIELDDESLSEILSSEPTDKLSIL